MIARAHHLHDERLFDCYVAERGGDALDPPAAEHLADCSECAARYAELVRFMNGVRAEAEAETDEIYTSERLHAQRQQIARRVAQLGRTAQIIHFPGRLVSHMNASAARGVTRWIYAAAAAGLVIGVGLGAFYDAEWRLTRRANRPRASARQVNTAYPIAWSPAATVGTTAAHETSDEAFLSDLELALERPRTRELQAFDALTPHVREVGDRVR